MVTWMSSFFHSPASFLSEYIVNMHDYVVLFLSSIFFLIMINMFFLFFCKFFSSEFFESHQLETVWTLIPFVLLVFILVPSLKVLYNLDSCFFCGPSFSVVGHQWYWEYENMSNYSSNSSNFSEALIFDSYMIPTSESMIRLLEVDNSLLVPTGLPIRFIVGSSDVIHSWTVPSLGFKMDAVPGRVNQFCVCINRPGIFFGQCSEICGANHSFMPIVLESVALKDFLHLFS